MRLRSRVTAAVLASILAIGAVGGVRTANAAEEAVGTAPAPAPDRPPRRQVDLIAEEPDLTYWIYDNQSGPAGKVDSKKIALVSTFRILCTVPCAVPMAPGTYSLGISRGNGSLVTVPAMTLKGTEVLKATYNSRWAMRLGFLLGGLVTASIGAAVAFSGEPSNGRQALGVGVLAIGVLGMVTPIFVQDRARIDVLTP